MNRVIGPTLRYGKDHAKSVGLPWGVLVSSRWTLPSQPSSFS